MPERKNHDPDLLTANAAADPGSMASADATSEAATLAQTIAARLESCGQTVALCETAAGGLMSAALLAVPGASAFYVGAAIAYSRGSRQALLDLRADDVRGLEPMSEPMVLAFARHTRARLGSDWGIAELGIAGPASSPYGGPAGVAVLAVSGPIAITRRIETGSSDRATNMRAFASAGLALLIEAIEDAASVR